MDQAILFKNFKNQLGYFDDALAEKKTVVFSALGDIRRGEMVVY